jgi:hypothetical protein
MSDSKARIDRARKQRILLIGSDVNYRERRCKFMINGTGVRVYDVVWDFEKEKFTCECPDYTHRQRDCKHIYFVMIHVLKIRRPEDVDLVDIDDAIRNCDTDRYVGVSLNGDVAVTQRMNEECCVCLMEFVDTPDERTTYCVESCGNTFHSECLRQLFKVVKNKNCPMCRKDMK